MALTACNGVKNTAKLTEGLEATVTRTVVNDDLSGIIASDITSAAINNYGVVTWSDNDTYAGYTYYYLPQGSSSPITSSTPFSFVSPYGCGIYYTASSNGYSYYHANGHLRDSDTPATYSGGRLTFSDGTVYNVVDGVAIADGDPFSVSYEEAGTADIVTSNYRIVGSMIYDKSGNFVRSFDINALCEIPETAIGTPVKWTIEDYIYVQYTYALPLDAKKYDYAEDLGKAKLVTKRYDIKKDKVKEFKNFDYVVEGAETLTDLATGDKMRPTEYAVLSVSEIGKDKQRGQSYIQTFKKNLGIYVNLQKLMPGATEIALYGGNVILGSEDTGETAVFDGKDEIASFIPAATRVNGGQAYRYGNNFYNFAGGHIYTLDSNEELLHDSIYDSISENGVLWVRDNSSTSSMTVKAINLANNSTTTYTEVDIISGSTDYLSVANGSAVDVIDMNTGNVIISGISDTASISIPTQAGYYRLIRVTENGISEFYRYGVIEKKA